jgi:AraC-like DNA-binding protein/mannose-6-phosphate isomerase-like protein (cupin superfamily)
MLVADARFRRPGAQFARHLDFTRRGAHDGGMDASQGWSSDVIPRERSFLVVHESSPKWNYWVHTHHCFELIHMARGDGYALVGDRSGEFAPGELYLLAPGVPHSFYSEGFLPDKAMLEMLCVYFRPDLADAERVPELRSAAALLARARRGLRFSGVIVGEVAGLLREMLALPPELSALVKLYAVLDRLARSGSGDQLSEREVSSRFHAEEMARLDAVRAVIGRRYRESLSLETVAKAARIGATSLNQLLRKYHQQTFLGYLTALRIGEAKRLLRETDRDIIDIALAAGFGSLATFNRRFRAGEQRSPQEYRVAHR